MHRSFLLYIPHQYPISGTGIFLYPDDDVSAETYLTSSGWKQVSEQTGAALILLESLPGGWDRRNIQREISCSEAVFKKAADVSEELLKNDAARICRQDLKRWFDHPNGLPMVEIWHTEPDS